MHVRTIFVVLVLVLMLALQVWVRENRAADQRGDPRPIAPRGRLDADERSTIKLFRRASPSVVNITLLAVQRDFFSRNMYQIPEGTGSGIIWDETGHIVTNFHVIQSSEVAQVTLADHSTWKARRVGVAPDKDLAVLRIEAPKSRLKPTLIGTSDDLQVGQKVYAIGNPFGLDQTLTTGIISALGREIESVTRRPIQGVIQTDAAINPGNSGGPLLDSSGRLVGVNTAIFSPSGTSVGIGFAIPVNTVNRIVPQLIRFGKVTRPGFGVQVAEDQLTQEMGLSGVLIVEVRPGGAGAKAGLRGTHRDFSGQVILGDVIVAINEKRIQSVKDLFLVLEKHQLGETVTVSILRQGKTQKFKVTLRSIG